jgi:hypothetical protein
MQRHNRESRVELRDKVEVEIGDIAHVLSRVHNLLMGIDERTLREILNGKRPMDKLNERIQIVKKDIIKILAECTENGGSLNPEVTPYIWQADDIIKQLGGAK